MHQKVLFRRAFRSASARSSSLSKKLLDSLNQLLGGLDVLLLIKVRHADVADLRRGDDAVLEHGVEVLAGVLLAAGHAALVVDAKIPGGGNALEGELLAVHGDLLLLCHILSIAPFG